MIKCGIDSLGFSISEPQQRPSPAVVPFNENPTWASSSVGRTPDWQSGCRGFDSHLCPQVSPHWRQLNVGISDAGQVHTKIMHNLPEPKMIKEL